MLGQVTECDVLVVIVAHRYGWEPEDRSGEDCKSITWLECDQAVKDGREVLAFLLEESVRDWPDQYREDFELRQAMEKGEADAQLFQETNLRIRRLKEFKAWLNASAIREPFVSPEDLRGKVESALRAWRNRHPEFAAISAEIRAAADPTKYLRDLWTATGYIDIRGLAVGSEKAHRFPIEALYVALSTAEAGRKGRYGEATRVSSERGVGNLAGALSQPRLVVVGDPGAGKSTFLHWIAHSLAGDRLGETEKATESRLGLSRPLLPILVRVAEWIEHMRGAEAQKYAGCPTTATSPQWLAHYLGARAQAANQGLHEA